MDYLKILCALQRCYIDNEFIIWIASSYYMDKDIITWNCSIISGRLIFHLESLFLGDTVLYGALLLPRVINWNYYYLDTRRYYLDTESIMWHRYTLENYSYDDYSGSGSSMMTLMMIMMLLLMMPMVMIILST